MRNVIIYPITYLLLSITGLFVLSMDHFYPQQVAFLLLSILWLAPLFLWPEKLHPWLITLLSFGAAMIYFKELQFFLPALLYGCGFASVKSKLWLLPIVGLPILLQRSVIGLIVAALCLLALLISENQQQLQKLSKDYLLAQDDAYEKQNLLREKNDQLLETRASTLELQVAEERNRIARDIHDNVGHLLSSSIIQLGAIKTINKQTNLQAPLDQLEVTIHRGMDNIRQSVHDLHQDSLSFSEGLTLLLSDFTFAKVSCEGTFSNELQKEEAKALLAITKEALANIMKHSNATEVQIICETLPAFYRYQIRDNGSKSTGSNDQGIGLIAMRQRLVDLKGQLHHSQSVDGYKVTVVLPRKSHEGASL